MSVGSASQDVWDDRPAERRSHDVRLALIESKFVDHVRGCEEGQVEIKSRLGRIEKFIVTALVAILTGGTVTLGFLLKIVLHLG